ncbi:MAG: hypothetical protein Q8L85_03630 [Alphaproteobacteria bacterium]|nr:hypothetical protein [Alphaproteobacteria bacterium]
MRYIFVLFMLITMSLETNATLEPLELILQLKSEGRKAEDQFPGLRDYFEQNSQMIRAKIERDDLRTLFDDCYVFAQNEFDQRGLTLYSNMIIHMMYASILTFQQKQDETPKDNTALIEAIEKCGKEHKFDTLRFTQNLKPKPVFEFDDLKDLIQEFKALFHNKKQDGSLNAYKINAINDHRIGAQPVPYATCISELSSYGDFLRIELEIAKTFFESEETDEEFCQNHSVSFWHVMPKAFKSLETKFQKLFRARNSIIARLYFAETAQLYLMPIVSETGILEINDLNKASANAIGLIGVSLDRTNYDGALQQTTLSAAEHDITHVEHNPFEGFAVNGASEINPDEYCDILKNYYGKCNNIYQKMNASKQNLSEQQQREDQLVYFFVDHEKALPRVNCNTNSITRSEFCDAIDNALSFIMSPVNDVQQHQNRDGGLYDYINIESSMNDFGQFEYLGKFNIILNLQKDTFEPMSIIEFIQQENIKGANIPLDQPLSFKRSPDNDHRFSYKGYHAVSFGDYNLLLDYINMLKPEIDLQLWEEDGEIDFLKIKRSFKRIFEDFKNRYKDQFPED